MQTKAKGEERQTSVRVRQSSRDELARIAQEELGGASLDEALAMVLFQHATMRAVERLSADPAALDDWQTEAREWADLDTAVDE